MFLSVKGGFLKKRLSAVVVIMMFLANFNRALAENIEFNTDILDVNDKANIDMSSFSRAGYVTPGKYIMSLRVNRQEISEQAIEWVVPDTDPKGSEVCLTPEIVNGLALKQDMANSLLWFRQGGCLDLSSLPGTEFQADFYASVINLSIPQAYMEYQYPNWDPPSRWDNGLTGVMTDYYASIDSQQSQHGGSRQSISGSGTTGINFGAWRLRGDWQANSLREKNGRDLSWNWSRLYAYRALPLLRAKMSLGENSLYSDLFDSFLYTGASLQTDDAMLPPDLRGYAPEISGIAKTNAKVTVSKQGRVLIETRVASGPFRIQHLNEAVSGTLDVTVEEQDGSVQKFTVNTATVPYLTRAGLVRYKLAVGRPSDNKHQTDGPQFATGEFSWGVNNGWSLFAGTVASRQYNAAAVGIGRDLLMLGAMSFDVTRSQASLPDEAKKLSGNSYRLNYSKRFDSTDSQVTFAGYRFSEQNFMSMEEYLFTRRYGARAGGNKEHYTLTLSQHLRSLRLSAYVNYSHQTYWDRPVKDRYTLTLSSSVDIGSLRNVTVSATAFSNSYNNVKDDGGYLSLSLPWGNSGRIGYSNSWSRGRSSHQASYSGLAANNDSYQVNAGISNGGNSASGSWNHAGDVMQVNTNASYQLGSYSSVGVSLQGGMTATVKGAALHRSGMPGGTRMMLDTQGIAGIPVKSFGNNTWTNSFGKAVVSDVGSYTRNRVSIDLSALAEDVEATHSVVQATLTEGAIGYRKFDLVSGRRAMATLRLADGSYPPFGASAVNSLGQNTGIVGDGGSVYLSGIQPGDVMRVVWGEESCDMEMPQVLPGDLSQQLLLPCISQVSEPKKAVSK